MRHTKSKERDTGMTPKTLEVKSRYNEFDLDKDGVVSDEELDRAKEMMEMELREEKS